MNSKHQVNDMFYNDNKTKEWFTDIDISCVEDDMLVNEIMEITLKDYSIEGKDMEKMTEKDMERLRYALVEGVAIQLSHEYEDEESFEKKFGNTETLEDAVALYCRYKNDEDVRYMCQKWISKFPIDKEYLLSLFGQTERCMC